MIDWQSKNIKFVKFHPIMFDILLEQEEIALVNKRKLSKYNCSEVIVVKLNIITEEFTAPLFKIIIN